jgi:hypothetical protein
MSSLLKKCVKCKKNLPQTSFETKKIGGLYSTCKECRPKNNQQSRQSYHKKIGKDEEKNIIILPPIELKIFRHEKYDYDYGSDNEDNVRDPQIYYEYAMLYSHEMYQPDDILKSHRADCVIRSIQITNPYPEMKKFILTRDVSAYFDFENVRSISMAGILISPEIFTFTHPLLVSPISYQFFLVEPRDSSQPIKMKGAFVDIINNPFFYPKGTERIDYPTHCYNIKGGTIGFPTDTSISYCNQRIKSMDQLYQDPYFKSFL